MCVVCVCVCVCVCMCVCVHAQTGCITFLASTSPLQPSQRYWLRPSSSSISTKLSFNLFSREPPPDRATGRSRNSSCADNNYIIHVPQELARNLPAQTYYIAAMWRKTFSACTNQVPSNFLSHKTRQRQYRYHMCSNFPGSNILHICTIFLKILYFTTAVTILHMYCHRV